MYTSSDATRSQLNEQPALRLPDTSSVLFDRRLRSVPNEKARLEDGREVWLSRAMAVVGLVVCHEKSSGKSYVALSKRGSAVPDFQGQYCLVSGYLDWEETLAEALAREVYEEIGLNLYELQDKGIVTIPDQPYQVYSGMNDARQNVTARFLVEFQVDRLPQLNFDNAEVGEVSDVLWLELTHKNLSKYQLAFNHNTVIEEVNSWRRWY